MLKRIQSTDGPGSLGFWGHSQVNSKVTRRKSSSSYSFPYYKTQIKFSHPSTLTLNMADGYWNRQQTPAYHLPSSASNTLKRHRTDYDVTPPRLSSNHEMHDYLSRDDDRVRFQNVKDTKTIGSAYDRYLQNAQLSSFTSGEAGAPGGAGLGRAVGSGSSGMPLVDSPILGHHPRTTTQGLAPSSRDIGRGDPHLDTVGRPDRETFALPRDATNTLYIEGFPHDCTRREVAHIFRPFVGYKEVRLVTKESKHRGGDPIILCFVDFVDAACAATALSALQGYKMDDHDPDSKFLRLQFSRFPGPRSGPGSRGKR